MLCLRYYGGNKESKRAWLRCCQKSGQHVKRRRESDGGGEQKSQRRRERDGLGQKTGKKSERGDAKQMSLLCDLCFLIPDS